MRTRSIEARNGEPTDPGRGMLAGMSTRGTTRGTTREWSAEEGWGVIDSPQTPGGCWTHFSVIQAEGYHALSAGQEVELEWDSPGQDGYPFRAVRVHPL